MAFESRLQYEKVEHNQIIKTNQFYECIKILLNGFISSSLYNSKSPIREYTFINPSLTDFLIGYVNDSFPERKGIISSALFVEQLSRFNPDKKILPLEKELQLIIRDKISNKQLDILDSYSKNFTENKRHSIYLEVLCKYCNQVSSDNLLLEHFIKITFSESWDNILPKIEYFLLNLSNAPQTFRHIKENFIKIIEKVMDSISQYTYALSISELFKKYENSYEEYSESQDGFNKLLDVMQSILYSSEEDIRSQHEDDIQDIDVITNLYDEIQTLETDLKSELFPNTNFEYNFNVDIDWDYWKNKIEENIKKAEIEFLKSDDYDKEYYHESMHESRSEDAAIDDLFTKSQ
jgi:hypothetical protein